MGVLNLPQTFPNPGQRKKAHPPKGTGFVLSEVRFAPRRDLDLQD